MKYKEQKLPTLLCVRYVNNVIKFAIVDLNLEYTNMKANEILERATYGHFHNYTKEERYLARNAASGVCVVASKWARRTGTAE
jgi:hypothetical protein